MIGLQYDTFLKAIRKGSIPKRAVTTVQADKTVQYRIKLYAFLNEFPHFKKYVDNVESLPKKEDILTTKQIADALDISMKAVHDRKIRGDYPSVKTPVLSKERPYNYIILKDLFLEKYPDLKKFFK